MIAESGDFTVSAILAWMGDLSQERNIAKHAARQGLVSVFYVLDAYLYMIVVTGAEYNAGPRGNPMYPLHRRRFAQRIVRTISRYYTSLLSPSFIVPSLMVRV